MLSTPQVLSGSVSDATTATTTLLQVRRGTSNFYVSYRTLVPQDGASYDKNLTAAWANHVFVHRYLAGVNTLLQGRVPLGGGYMNTGARLYVSFDAADTATSTATVTVSRCVQTQPVVTVQVGVACRSAMTRR